MATIASTMTLVELRLDITHGDAFALSIAGWPCLRTLRKLHLFYQGVSIGSSSLFGGPLLFIWQYSRDGKLFLLLMTTVVATMVATAVAMP